MRRVSRLLLSLSIVTLVGLIVRAQADVLPCEGPEGPYEVRVSIPCSEIATAEIAAERFRDSLLLLPGNETPEALAAALNKEADRLGELRPERGTVGLLDGVDRWGCERGYTRTNLCQGFVLRKTDPAQHGYSVVYEVTSASISGGASYFDTASAVQSKAPSGDTKVQVGLSLVFQASITEPAAPQGYEEEVKARSRGEARALLNEILAFSEEYRGTYVQALRGFADRISNPPSPTEQPEPIELVLEVTAEGHLPFTQDLNLSSQDVSLVSITGIAVDELGLPIPDAAVRFQGWSAVTTTDAQGSFRLSIFGSGRTPIARGVQPVLQRVLFEIVMETSPTSGAPYLGVAADGASTLAVSVITRGIRSDSVSVRTPRLGEFERAPRLGISIPLDSEGRGSALYIPPAFVPTEDLGHASSDSDAWNASVPITFDFEDVGGRKGTATIEILVCRPPLLLVGGPASDPLLWGAFKILASGERLDCRLSQGTLNSMNGLEEEALVLRSQIQQVREEFTGRGIKLSKVDLVAHGLGGLVSRAYVESTLHYGEDVRKLVLIATPNHGISWLDQRIAAPAVSWIAAHPQVAAEVFEESEFIRRLNNGESTGSHLNASVEYVNLIGKRSAVSAAPDANLGVVEDDGVVSSASAHLNGVKEYVFERTCYTSGLSLPDVPIVDSPDLWIRVLDILQRTVIRPEADETWMEVQRGGGDVEVCRETWTGSWMSNPPFPMPIDAESAIRTGKGGYAVVGFHSATDLWGTLSIDEDSEVFIRYGSPGVARIQVTTGRVRFHPSAEDPQRYVQVVAIAPRGASPWFELQPGVRVLGRGSDFVVLRAEAVTVYALDGRLLLESAGASMPTVARFLESSTGLRTESTGAVEEVGLPLRGWWTIGTWREPSPPFQFPMWILGAVLACLVGATLYYVQSRKRWSPKRKSE